MDFITVVEYLGALLALVGVILLNSHKKFNFVLSFFVFLMVNSLMLIFSTVLNLPFLYLASMLMFLTSASGFIRHFRDEYQYKTTILLAIVFIVTIITTIVVSKMYFLGYEGSLIVGLNDYFSNLTKSKFFEIMATMVLIYGTFMVSLEYSERRKLIAVASFLVFDLLITVVYIDKSLPFLIMTMVAIIYNAKTLILHTRGHSGIKE